MLQPYRISIPILSNDPDWPSALLPIGTVTAEAERRFAIW